MSKTTDIIARIGPPAPARAPEAIQTYFAGHHFRSRSEARWAVFYQAAGITWRYELEGFELGGGVRYLPDFWLPDQDCWVEIKGAKPDELEQRKARLLSEATGKRVLIFWGGIPHKVDVDGPKDTDAAWLYAPGCCEDTCYAWCECPNCGLLGVQYEARADRLPCKGTGCARRGDWADRNHNGDSPKLLRAYQAARHCRFDRSDVAMGGAH